MCDKCNDNHEHTYVCECGKEFHSSASIGGHQARCKIHREVLKRQELEKEQRRLPNGLFKCENPGCPNEHDGSYGTGRFCSKSCRCSYIAKQVKNRKCGFLIKNHRPKARHGTWKCSICETILETRRELQKHMEEKHPRDKTHPWNYGKRKETDKRLRRFGDILKTGYSSGRLKTHPISEEARKKLSELAKQRKFGGFTKGGGRGKRGWYKGYWCDSSWELAYVIYNLEHDIHFVRNRVGFEYEYGGMVRKYYPDYILDDGTYVEVKGYEDEKVKVKHSTFISSGHILNVIGGEEIKPYLQYVIEKYGKDFTRLYE